MKMRSPVLLALGVLVGCSGSNLPRENTREEIVAYVGRAAAQVEASGPAVCEEFQGPAWMEGDWYVFILEQEGPVACHPARPDLVATPSSGLIDPNGKRIGDEFLRVASSPEGRGWVEYVWARPGESAPVAKSSYVERVTGPDGKVYVVGSGGYEVP